MPVITAYLNCALGLTRAKKVWAVIGVDGMGIANEIHAQYFVGMPRLTVRMAARVQGFPGKLVV